MLDRLFGNPDPFATLVGNRIALGLAIDLYGNLPAGLGATSNHSLTVWLDADNVERGNDRTRLGIRWRLGLFRIEGSQLILQRLLGRLFHRGRFFRLGRLHRFSRFDRISWFRCISRFRCVSRDVGNFGRSLIGRGGVLRRLGGAASGAGAAAVEGAGAVDAGGVGG